ARQPVEIIGGPRQHYRSSTQGSFVPPPWLELTTSEPFFSATRVSPPGTMRTRARPVHTNGRRSTGRGAPPPYTQEGRGEGGGALGDEIARVGLELGAERRKHVLVGLGADQHAVAAGAVHLLDHQLIEVVEHVVQVLLLAAAPGRHVLQDRLLAKIEFHDRR